MVDETASGPGGRPALLTLVLGVHRSGTSLLAQGLRALGANIDEFTDVYDNDNPDGYAEHPAVRRLNDRLLGALDASWDNWGFRASTVDWEADNLAVWYEEAVEVLQGAFKGHGPFALKDPRCVTLAPFWERAVRRAGFQPRRVLIVRDPAEVAESQRQRTERRPLEFPVIAEAESMAALWTVNMVECLSALSDDATLLVSHAGLLSDPAATFATVAEFAGLTPEEGALDRFTTENVKPALYRARAAAGADHGAWMQAARSLYNDLLAAGAPRPLSAADAKAIAAAQHRFEALSPALPAARSSIARMQMIERQRTVRADAISLMVWNLSPLASRATPAQLGQAIDRIIALADTTDIARTRFVYVHTLCRLLVYANRHAEAAEWLERGRPFFKHVPLFAELEAAAKAVAPTASTSKDGA